ncbi:cholecystokinin receptor type A-like [Mercenaria mercenaria]|uniref:cholecystokinin receptor type A-like n=1 Tax=Mercenaria mercenaria TaxID=6596 RepID=UPI00234E6417|nr:cholecystokinin receptor type A-like [Mercenaria mercenaria]XP_053383336.1 cholecystokinin receptor type A-like [Mercenaria mercenaria]
MEKEETNLTLEELDEEERSKHFPLTVLLVIIMVIGIVGNTLVLIIYKRKFTRSSARSYILSLAIADLSVCLVGIPYHVLDLTLILTYTHINLCKVLSFFIGACTLSSVFILLVVGLDRYFKVCRPLKRQIRDFGDRKACVLATFVAVVISIPNGIIYGQSAVQTPVNNLTGVECFIADEYHGSDLAVGYLGFNLLVFVISVLFLIIIYGFICRKIYQQDKMSGEIMLKKTKTVCLCCTVENQEEEDGDGEVTGAMNNEVAEDVRVTDDGTDSEFQSVNIETEETEKKHLNSKLTNVKSSKVNPDRKAAVKTSCAMIRHKRPGSKAGEKNTMKITLMMMTITIVFVISYLPFIVISIIDSIDETLWFDMPVAESLLLDLMLRLYLINNVANPVIYSFWDKRFRKEIKRLLRKVACCFKNDEVSEDQSYTKSRSGMSTSCAYTKNTEAVTDK